MKSIGTLAGAALQCFATCLGFAGLSAQSDTTARTRKPNTVAADSSRVPADTTKKAQHDTTQLWGDIVPGKGFLVANTDVGTLSISGYGLARFITQLPATATYVNHLGETKVVDARQDIQWHRVQVHFLGWVYLRKLRYVLTVWTVNATQQVAVAGSLTYHFARQLNLGAGINGLPGTRSLNGSHPLWLATDRFMADEYFRPGFTSGIWATGEALPRLFYSAMLGDNLSQLGITAAQLTRSLAPAASIWWMPTTGEFGPKGAYGDYEYHERLATRIGTSYTFSREDRFSELSDPSPDNTQIRLSDATLLFQEGALAPGVTIIKANYRLSATDIGLKYRGAFLQAEVYHRWLNDFLADGTPPLSSLYDMGYYIAAAFFPIPRRAEVYLFTSQIYGSFNRSWEVSGGGNWYPAKTRNFRVNAHIIRVNRSPVSSVFGYYVGGQRGTTLSLATSVFF